MIEKKIAEFPIIYTTVVPKIAIGWGAYETVADECKKAHIKKALIVTTGLRGTGIIDEINQILTTQGIATEIYNKVTSNPKDYQVMEAYGVFKDAGCDGVVSIGGGSSHDCGKGVRIAAANDGQDICEFASYLKPARKPLESKPVTTSQIAVNTTAGTGAETSPFAAITNTRTRTKLLISGPGAGAAIAIIDPLLVRHVPRTFAAWCGFDALTHATEGFVSRIAVPYSAAMGFKAIQIIAENIREFVYNRMNQKACENMCWAASVAGVGLALGAGVGIVHALAHQIGAVTDAHHGLSNAAVMLPAERLNALACPERFGEMAKAMGVDTRGMTKMQAADKWIEEIERLMADLDIRPGHLNEQFGLQKKDLNHIINAATNDMCIEGNPVQYSLEEILKLLEGML